MIEAPICPLCERNQFELLSTRTFLRSDVGTNWSRRMRNRVLFELWHPTVDELTIAAVLCVTCGFIGIEPRPTQTDVERKYRFYEETSARSEKAADAEQPHVRKIDRLRSRELFDALARFTTHCNLDVLDFGGRTGALMAELVDRGARCGVVDSSPIGQVPGVRRLGRSLDDLPPEFRFDLIVASHVLEHAADPLAVARILATRLTVSGMLFVEVPLEIRGMAPPLKNPAAHLSYFTEPSLRYLLKRAGFQDVVVWTETATFESRVRGDAIRAVARTAWGPGCEAISEHIEGAAEYVRQLIGMSSSTETSSKT